MKETLKKLHDNLRPLYGERETEAIIKIIFHFLKGWNTTDILINADTELSDFVKKEIDDILRRLKNFEPIQYITGEARFHGMEFFVDPAVLIPRPETDELVDIIVENVGDKEDLKILDLGTGSGCISIALARSLRFPVILATDISEKALAVEKKNAEKLKVKNDFKKLDMLSEAPSGKFDIIVSNPPYVTESEKIAMEPNVLEYEPHNALFVPDDNPLLYYYKIVEIALKDLLPEGRLYMEINPLFSTDIEDLLKKNNFREVRIIRDSSGKNRFASAIKRS